MIKFKLDKLVDGSLLFQLLERSNMKSSFDVVHKGTKYTIKLSSSEYHTTNIVYYEASYSLNIRLGKSKSLIVFSSLRDGLSDGIKYTDLLMELIPLAFQEQKKLELTY